MCDFCQSKDMSIVYNVADSALGVKIAVCDRCGLVQSIKTKSKQDNARVASTSSGAGWGNIRYGKGFRLQPAVRVLDSYIDWSSIKDIADIGSNRGDFVKWVSKNHPHADVLGIEPDGSVVGEYKDLPGISLYTDRFENIPLPENRFDLIYCSHTLEHADSASQMLKDIHNCLKNNGYLFLEVPDIEFLKSDDIIEEFFIDKHTFHFNQSLLLDYALYLGFEVLYPGDVSDNENITLLLIKTADKNKDLSFSTRDASLPAYNRQIIEWYQTALSENHKKLKHAVNKIHQLMLKQKVAFWGAGRLFDSLVRIGSLNVEDIHCLVDTYLGKYLTETHGVEIRKPEYLKAEPPHVVIVMSRGSADEITTSARNLGIRNVIKIRDLLLS